MSQLPSVGEIELGKDILPLLLWSGELRGASLPPPQPALSQLWSEQVQFDSRPDNWQRGGWAEVWGKSNKCQDSKWGGEVEGSGHI